MEKIIEITPAFDKRHPDPSKNCGIHGCSLRMILKGDKGATQFVLYTNWQLPHVQEEMLTKFSGSYHDVELFLMPMPADLGYHSKVPRYEGQISLGECKYLDGEDCYYDGSGLNAKRVYKILLEKGSDGVWEELEDYYNNLFGEE